MKNKLIIFLIMILFFASLFFILYPTISDLWNSMHQTKAISKNIEDAQNLKQEEYESVLEEARRYNESISKKSFLNIETENIDEYNSALNISSDGIMGYIEIPKINVKLAIYHGTSEEVLQVAVGHMQGSSLPVGGESSHSVLLGHRGLPSAKLFTSLDKMVEGDIFYLNFLKEKIAYKVNNITVVEPKELENLKIEEGQDNVTLVTCTPYGINSHRLLVQGIRTEISEDLIKEVNKELSTNAYEKYVIAIILIFISMILLMIKHKRKRGKNIWKYLIL